MSARVSFQAKLWRYQGTSAWHFVTAPRHASEEIRVLSNGLRTAFGSVRVIATIGTVQWRTSLFPDSKADAYLLPVKADVRRKQNLADGDVVDVVVEIDL